MVAACATRLHILVLVEPSLSVRDCLFRSKPLYLEAVPPVDAGDSSYSCAPPVTPSVPSIVISVFVCLSVGPHVYFRNHSSELHLTFCADCPWPWQLVLFWQRCTVIRYVLLVIGPIP